MPGNLPCLTGHGGSVPTIAKRRRSPGGLGGVLPTPVRTFAPGDVVHAFVELAAGRPSNGSIAVAATIHDAQGYVVLTRDARAVSKPRQPARQTLKLPIEDARARRPALRGPRRNRGANRAMCDSSSGLNLAERHRPVTRLVAHHLEAGQARR